MLPASTVPQSGQVLVSHHCRVSSMTYSLHLNLMIRQMVSRGLVYPLRVSRLTYTAPLSRSVCSQQLLASSREAVICWKVCGVLLVMVWHLYLPSSQSFGCRRPLR